MSIQQPPEQPHQHSPHQSRLGDELRSHEHPSRQNPSQQHRGQQPSNSPTQQKYEVRFDWGVAGLARIAPTAGLIVLVDAFKSGTTLAASDLAAAAQAVEVSENGPVPVLDAGVPNAAATAKRALELQHANEDRLRIAIIAQPDADGGFAVQNLLASGAVIDELAALGIDYSSPEAAAACAAFTGLRRAVAHLFTASVAGQALIEAGERDLVVAAGRPNPDAAAIELA